MKKFLIASMLTFMALAGLVLAGPIDGKSFDKCFASLQKEFDRIEVPSDVRSFIKKITDGHKVPSVDDLSPEVLAKYTAPKSCGPLVGQVQQAFQDVTTICGSLDEDEMERVLLKATQNYPNHMQGSLACQVCY